MIDLITTYYGNAIRQNKTCLSDMRKAVWAVYFHIRSSDEEPLHSFCPVGPNSWCKYQNQVVEGSVETFRHSNKLSVAVMNAIKPVFNDLSQPKLLQKCLGGKTQNNNESINSLIWKLCPKTLGCGRKIVDISTNEAIVIFNDGNQGRLKIMQSLGLTVGQFAHKFVTLVDIKRIQTAEVHFNLRTKEVRQAKRMQFKTTCRIIGKLEEGRSVTSVAAEFGIAHSIVSRLWRQFQTTGTAIQRFSCGRPRGTTPADDRYIVLQARRNRRQTAGEIARHTTQATGRPISRFTVARRLHGGGLFARCPVRCATLTPVPRRRRSLWCRKHRNWRDNEWRRVLFTDESRFSLSSDSHRILIRRERGSRNHPSNIIERYRYGGRGVLVWGGIMLGSRTDLHIFDAGSVNGTRYCNEILLPYVRLFRGAMGLQFLFMDDNAPCHRIVAAEHLLESEDIESMDWPARSPDLNTIEYVWDFLGRRLAARTLPPITIRELRLALQE
ncbi:transposable element Tc1 transposase [Trichonephila clavipes]|nr:transposable element Tc1 transposase [Trichonephila clavipes]